MTVKSNLFFKDCQVPTPLGRIVNEKLFENGKHHLMLESFTNWRDIHSYNTINCSQISPIIETISTDFKCFTLFHNQTIKITDANYQIPKDVAGYLKYLAWIKLNRDFIFNGLIYIHSPKLSHQYSQTSSIQQLDPDRHQFVSIAFEREVLQLLPAPYETNCYDYRQDGYSCRDDCITKCKTEIYTQMDGWPGDVYALKNVTMRLSKLWLNSWSMVGHLEEGVSAESLSKCSFKCGHRDDCESVQYDVRTVRVKERDEGDSSGSHSYTIGILPPKNVQLINKHVPKYEPIEFLIYIGGLISLYTGITAISLGYNIFSWLTFTNKVQNNWIFNKSSKSAAHNYKDANATELLQVKTFDSQAQAPFLKTKF
ncbi:hypothetical protein BLOT_004546 [Blomia tropicalis]|nr:hypothetical protein BLOT_004546 [Blomia tropicalis]